MDIDFPPSDAPFSYPSHSSQTVPYRLPDAASTAVVDYADTLGNPQPVQKATYPSYNIATTNPTNPIHGTKPCNSQHASLSVRSPQPVQLSGSSNSASLAHPVERGPPWQRPENDINVAAMNFRSRRKKRPCKAGRDLMKKEGREAADRLNAAQIKLREERIARDRNGIQAVSGASNQESSIQDCFNRLTVNENNHSGHLSARNDPLDHLSQTTATTSFSAEKPVVEFGFISRSDITASSSQTNDPGKSHPVVPTQSADSSSWAALTAQALKNRNQPGKQGKRSKKGKEVRRPRDLSKRLIELEKQITTLRHSGDRVRSVKRKINNVTRQALVVRTRIEEDEGRLTALEAKELRKANAKMLGKRSKMTEHEKGVDSLVDGMAMLL
ncbi:hypothetical protein MMC26_001974 [Xylographa opegraphella]|nr:hypothetical protein [Xylographa opegraphella]